MARANLARIRKRPARVSKSKVKKPAAAPIMKRPAAAPVVLNAATGLPNMKDVFERLREDFPRLNKNAFCPRAYDTATRRCQKAHAGDAKMKTFRKAQHVAASEFYEKLDAE